MLLAGRVGGPALQVLVNLRDSYRSFSHGGRHPLHRPRVHVADREHAGQAGFQRKRSWLAFLSCRCRAGRARSE